MSRTKYSKNDSEKDLEKNSDKVPVEFLEKDLYEKKKENDLGKYLVKIRGKFSADSGNDSGNDSGKDSGNDSGQHPVKDPGNIFWGKDSGPDSGNDSGKD